MTDDEGAANRAWLAERAKDPERQKRVDAFFAAEPTPNPYADEPNIPGCPCFNCEHRTWPEFFSCMVVCEACGNKRCPHATFHGNGCTGSNEPGQPGSRYAASPGRSGGEGNSDA